MSVLRNPKWELFAQEIAKGTEAGDAYIIAGFAPNSGNARRLKQVEAVKKRVEAILSERSRIHEHGVQKAIAKVGITVESLIAEAEEVRSEALKAGSYAAAISAIKEKGVLSGIRVEKRETALTFDPDKMTDAELAAIASQGSASAPETPSDKRQLN